MNMNFIRKLPTPKEIKELYPLSDELRKIKENNDIEIQKIFKFSKFFFIFVQYFYKNITSNISYCIWCM